MEDDFDPTEEIETAYITDMWSTHLDNKDGITFDLRKVETHIAVNRIKKISDLKLGPTCIRGIVPEQFLPHTGKEFRMYHYSVDGTFNYGVVKIEKCNATFEENGSFVFSSKESDEKFVLTPAEKTSN